MRFSEAYRETDYTPNIMAEPQNMFICSAVPGWIGKKAALKAPLRPIQLHLLESFTVFSILSFFLRLLETNMYHPSLFFPPPQLRVFHCRSSLCSRSLYFSTQGLKATWLAECCCSLAWSTLHKFHMIHFSKPTSQLDGKLVWQRHFCVG